MLIIGAAYKKFSERITRVYLYSYNRNLLYVRKDKIACDNG